jgi:AraC-like DNA-binding protein
VRRKAEREAREADLMQRIQRLAERVKQYEDASVRMVLDEDDSSDETGEAEPVLSAQEVDFMDRATQLVEQHMADSDYTVEQLARDLCMERTGLYKRLTSLAELSPVVFIRSIRLRRAAQLIRQGQHTITEVAELTGFGSVSYFSKCFQREFGCKPSAYK